MNRFNMSSAQKPLRALRRMKMKRVKKPRSEQCIADHGTHLWGSGAYAGVCMRCAHGAVDGQAARVQNAKQAEKERQERTREV